MSQTTPSTDNNILNQAHQEQQQYMDELRLLGKRKISITLTFLGLYLASSTLVYAVDENSFHTAKQTGSLAAIIFSLVLLMKLQPKILKYVPFIIHYFAVMLITEFHIQQHPEKQSIPDPFIAIFVGLHYQNSILVIDRKIRNYTIVSIIGSFFARLYLHYGYLKMDTVGPILTYIIYIDFITAFQNSQFQKITELFVNKQEIANEKLQTTLCIIPQGIILIDLESKEVICSNQEVLNILEITDKSEIKGSLETFFLNKKSSKSLFESETSSKEISLGTYLSSLALFSKEREDFIFKNKQMKKYLQVKAQFINKETQIIAIINNLTRMKELESQTTKMKSMFFASIAHELRTPLNTIIPMVQMLQKTTTDEKSLKIIQIVRDSSIFLQNVIEDALDMSRIENNQFMLNLECFNLREMVSEVCQIMEFQATQKALNFLIQISEKTPVIILSDPKRLKQILFNLIGNAIKFTFKGSITLKIEYEDSFLIASVIDTGIGIPQENIGSLFKFFGQIQSSKKINRGGMGLGLTISKIIVQQFNGEISVYSEYNKGSTFTFKIPLKDPNIVADDNNIAIEKQSSNSIFEESQWHDFKLFKQRGLPQQRPSRTKAIRPLVPRKSSQMIVDDYGEEECSFQDNYASFQFSNLIHLEPQFGNNDISILNSYSHPLHSSQDHHFRLPQNFKILLVDNQQDRLFVMKEILSQYTENIAFAKNEQEVIHQMKVNVDAIGQYSLFAFVMIDLSLPQQEAFKIAYRLNELELSRQVRLRNTKIIALSSLRRDQFLNTQYSELFDHLIEKPVELKVLEKLFN